MRNASFQRNEASIHRLYLVLWYKGNKLELEMRHAMTLIDKLNQAFILIDSTGIIIYSSASVTSTLGYSQQELLGLDFQKMLDCSQTRIIAQLHAFLGQVDKPFQKTDLEVCQFIHKGEKNVYGRVTIQSLILEEPTRVFVVSFTDISEEVKLNEDVKRLNKKLDLIASLFSHQIRGPVATIIGLSNIMNYASPMDPINNEVISRINTPLRQLDDAISRIVALSSECEILIEEYSSEKTTNL